MKRVSQGGNSPGPKYPFSENYSDLSSDEFDLPATRQSESDENFDFEDPQASSPLIPRPGDLLPTTQSQPKSESDEDFAFGDPKTSSPFFPRAGDLSCTDSEDLRLLTQGTSTHSQNSQAAQPGLLTRTRSSESEDMRSLDSSKSSSD